MQNLQQLSRSAAFFHVTLYASSVLLLSACSSSGVDPEPDQSALQIGAANTVPTSEATDPSGTANEGNSAEPLIPAQANTPVGGEVTDPSEPTNETLPVNLPPLIANTSYSCDPIIESALFDVGETDQFTLSVTDESPLTLTYSVDISSTETVSVEVAPSGVFTITALQSGESQLWLRAEDEDGLADEYELKVIVN